MGHAGMEGPQPPREAGRGGIMTKVIFPSQRRISSSYWSPKKLPGRDEDLSDICVPHFHYWTIKQWTPQKLEFPQEPHTGRRKRLKYGPVRRKIFSLGKRFHSVDNLGPIFLERPEPQNIGR